MRPPRKEVGRTLSPAGGMGSRGSSLSPSAPPSLDSMNCSAAAAPRSFSRRRISRKSASSSSFSRMTAPSDRPLASPASPAIAAAPRCIDAVYRCCSDIRGGDRPRVSSGRDLRRGRSERECVRSSSGSEANDSGGGGCGRRSCLCLPLCCLLVAPSGV
jgi:hypothetical protein